MSFAIIGNEKEREISKKKKKRRINLRRIQVWLEGSIRVVVVQSDYWIAQQSDADREILSLLGMNESAA